MNLNPNGCFNFLNFPGALVPLTGPEEMLFSGC